MTNFLKEKNRPTLLLVILANLVLFYVAVKTGSIFSEGFIANQKDLVK